MKRSNWLVSLALALVITSAVLYFIHYKIFHDLHHIFIYLLGDIAFLPIEVLLVTVIIHRLLGDREKKIRMEKLNMVIGLFFSEAGTKLLAYLSDLDPNVDEVKKELTVEKDWNGRDFTNIKKQMQDYKYEVRVDKTHLVELRSFLADKRDFFMRMLENPNLLEHENFTELLRAVFHLAEELEHRGSYEALPETDLNHLSADIGRVYRLIVSQWLDYMKHLKENFPYMFSLAMRTNPFDMTASPIVK
ncbi:MAG: hypothetical protein M1269_10700 [Chloroflexi bacterium]|nr:hypothetical protein [Chloroflexota bacterium]